jgi:hypothetical protein
MAARIDRYHHRPHSGRDYRTPAEVAQTGDDALADLQTHAPELSTRAGSRPTAAQVNLNPAGRHLTAHAA